MLGHVVQMRTYCWSWFGLVAKEYIMSSQEHKDTRIEIRTKTSYLTASVGTGEN